MGKKYKARHYSERRVTGWGGWRIWSDLNHDGTIIRGYNYQLGGGETEKLLMRRHFDECVSEVSRWTGLTGLCCCSVYWCIVMRR